ncbi:MAG TPA: SPFH domain-containing protein [Candidatus Saccharimonadales bacterium]|nr:SPFH domain-containing protein [Candidatus Saccharimonadales bacterium]
MLDGLLDFIGGGVIPIFLVIIVIVLIVSYIGSRYKVAGANEALVVSGQRDKSPDGRKNLKVVRGGGVIVLPLIHKVGKLKLTARQINVNLADAVTRQGIKVAVQGVATFKIGADDESIRNAAERFLESQEEAVDSIVKNVLEGSLRSIVGTLTVEELNLDRMKFQQAVQDAAKGDLATSGLQIDSFTIQAIRDESGYMELIGQQETARRERDARMAKASADQEAAVREAEAEQVKINAQRDVALRRAETETQTAAAEARAAQAGPLAEAEATQEVTRKQTELAQLEAARTQQELVATTVRPAEAEAEAQIRRAEGAKGAAIAQAQGDAERVKLAGEAQARVVEVTAEATAKQTTLEGNAEAGIVLSKGEAEAKALALRAEAYRQFNEAAVIQTVLSMLPEIVRAAAEPMSNIETLTVLSTEGASDLTKNVTRTLTEASTTVKGLTGIDIPELVNQAIGNAESTPGGGSSSGGGGASRPRPPAPPRGGGSTSGGTTGGSAPGGPAQAGGRTSSTRDRSPGAGSATAASTTPPEPAPPRFTSQEAIDAALADADRAVRAAGAPATPRTDTAAGPPRLASAEIGRSTTVSDAAIRLATDLRAVPGIDRFANVRLAELDQSGPRPLRTMWRIAREQLDASYGQLTIGELIDRYGSGRQTPA